MTDDVQAFLNESSGDFYPAMKFKTIGDFVTGKILDVPRVVEQPKIGNASVMVKKLLINLEVHKGKGVAGARDEDGTKEEVPVKSVPVVTVWVGQGLMAAAVSQAAKDAGEGTKIAEGGTLTLSYIEDKDTGKGNPAKVYRAKYEAPPRGVNVDLEFDSDDSPF